MSIRDRAVHPLTTQVVRVDAILRADEPPRENAVASSLLRVTYAVSRAALRAAIEANTDNCRAMFDGPIRIDPGSSDLHIVFEAALSPTTPSVISVYLVDPADHRRTRIAAKAVAVLIEDGPYLHIEAPDLLCATLRRGDASARPAYARTPLLARLGLRGGRYEVM